MCSKKKQKQLVLTKMFSRIVLGNIIISEVSAGPQRENFPGGTKVDTGPHILLNPQA